jgi:uncharacterized protein (TIGR02996 family)
MASERAFLADISEHVEDDAPRLVYADWLEDQGRPERSAFIRLQIEHARLEADDPRRFDLAEREREILAGHSSEWRKPLPAWTRRETCWFHRGFVAEVTATARQFLRGAAGLRKAAPLQGVSLRELGTTLRDVLPLLGGLRNLHLLYPRGAALLGSSAHLAGRRALDLRFDYGSTAGVGAVETLLASPHIGSLAGLRVVTGGQLDRILPLLTESRCRDSLTSLFLESNGSDRLPVSPAAAEELTRLPRLEALALHMGAGAGGLPALLATPAARNLRALQIRISAPGLSEGDLESLGRSPNLAGLRSLSLTHLTLDDERVRPVTESSTLRGLFHLDLSYSDLGPGAAEALAGNPHFTGLLTLNLLGARLGKAGARALASSPHLHGLRRLYVDQQHADEAGLKLLCERFGSALRDTNEWWTIAPEAYCGARAEDLRGIRSGRQPKGAE